MIIYCSGDRASEEVICGRCRCADKLVDELSTNRLILTAPINDRRRLASFRHSSSECRWKSKPPPTQTVAERLADWFLCEWSVRKESCRQEAENERERERERESKLAAGLAAICRTTDCQSAPIKGETASIPLPQATFKLFSSYFPSYLSMLYKIGAWRWLIIENHRQYFYPESHFVNIIKLAIFIEFSFIQIVCFIAIQSLPFARFACLTSSLLSNQRILKDLEEFLIHFKNRLISSLSMPPAP